MCKSLFRISALHNKFNYESNHIFIKVQSIFFSTVSGFIKRGHNAR